MLKRPELLILIILGFLVRIIGTNPGYFAHGDEQMYGEAVFMILNRTLGMEPQFLGYYPPLVAWIVLIFFIFIFIPFSFVVRLPELMSLSELFGRNWVNAMYWGRYTTVFFSTGVILLTYFVTKKLFNNRLTSFLAALFVTFNYRLILNSKIGFIDIYNVFFLLLALLLILNLYQKPTFKNYLISWVLIGLSFLVKYQTYAFPSFGFIHFINSLKSSKDRNFRQFTKNFLSKQFLVGGLVTTVIVLVSHYYHFLNWEKVKSLYEYQALKYGLGVNNLNIFPISYIFHYMLGPVATFAAFGGFVLGVIQKKYRIGTILLTLPIILDFFIYFYYSTGGTYTRNLLVVLPLALIFSAFFFTSLWRKFFEKRTSKIVKVFTSVIFFSLMLFSIKDQVTNAIIATEYLNKPSARILIDKWVNENISINSTIGVYQGSFVPDENKFKLKAFSGMNEAVSFKELSSENINYSIVDFYIANSSFVWWMGQPTDIGLRFWNKPNNLLSQSYTALAIRELLASHTIHAYLPKWQAPGYNYAITKINLETKREYEVFNKFNFDSDAQNWRKLNYFTETEKLLGYSNDNGSLVIENESVSVAGKQKIRRIYARPGSMRWESPPLKSEGNYAYKIAGRIKNKDYLNKSERNGFLRLDFYRETPKDLESRAIASYVSERVYSLSEWHEVSTEGIAPREAKFFAVSFQVDQGNTSFYLDEVAIYKSSTEVEDASQSTRHIITDDDFFNPNDGGFL